MKKYILTLTLIGTLIAPFGLALAQDAGGSTPPPPPGGQAQPQQPINGGGGFQPQQPPMDSRSGGFQPQPGVQPPQGGQFPPPQGGFREGNFPTQGGQFQKQPMPQEGQFQGQPNQGQTNQGQPMREQRFSGERRPPQDGGQQGQFPGKGATEGKFPGEGMTGGQFPGGGEQGQFGPENEGGGFEFESEGQEPQDFQDVVEPREIQQVQRQISDLKKQAQRLLTKAKKSTALANEAGEVQSFLNQLASYAESVQAGSRDALQEFYDAELWETMNGFQARIEMPAEISKMEKDLTRLEKLIVAKTFRVDGVDMNMVRSNIEEIRSAISGAKSALSSGDAESAREYLQVIYEGTHPGEIYGVLQQLRNITKELKRVKNADVRQSIIEVITPVYEAIATGDFREANMALNEINRELSSLFSKLRNTKTVNTDIRTKMRSLEQKLEGRIQQIETQETQGQPGAFIPYKSSERGLGSMISSVKNFFGF